MSSIKDRKGNQAPSGKHRENGASWLAASVALCWIVVGITASPVLQNPRLEPDDYRYLSQVQVLNQNFWSNFATATVVENRWDHLWWIDISQPVRFFRPTVVLSYWLDVNAWGSQYKEGLFVTNILIYAMCVALVCVILYRWLGGGLPLLVSSLLFASFSAHGEVMWYVAGRTDSIAAMFALAAVALHVYGTKRSALRGWAVLCFILAALTKELVVMLPLLFFLYDLWIEKRSGSTIVLAKREWRLYSVYVIGAAAILAIHLRIGSAAAGGYPYPYFITPQNPEFPVHVWSQLQSYSANLLFARWTVSFLPPTQVLSTVGLVAFLVGILMLAVVSYLLRAEPKYWFLLLLALLTWLPTISVYLNERYLLMPSFAVAGIVGLLLARLRAYRSIVRSAALGIAVVWAGHQAYSLDQKNRAIGSYPRLTETIEQQVEALRPAIAKGAKLLLLNIPADWLGAQFAGDVFRVVLNDPTLDATIITTMPRATDMGSSMVLSKEDNNRVRLESPRHFAIMEHGIEPCPQIPFDSGRTRILKSVGQIAVLQGKGTTCQALRFSATDSLGAYVALKWTPNPNRFLTPYHRMLRSTVEILNL